MQIGRPCDASADCRRHSTKMLFRCDAFYVKSVALSRCGMSAWHGLARPPKLLINPEVVLKKVAASQATKETPQNFGARYILYIFPCGYQTQTL
jgi:hypothetical protein